ncbi:MAG: 2-phospho-L-lactate transferase CofD family protein [Desulfovibrionaceae bacterium]|nr:2-phospho-L-lactate transferase CofD family protein [Desulfovibrionaceae bacterium]
MSEAIFFSGGTALSELAQLLSGSGTAVRYIVTTFDSGGSSAVLRRVFDMPAVGDIRSRLLAMADASCPETCALRDLLRLRFPEESGLEEVRLQLRAVAAGRHPLFNVMGDLQREAVQDLFAGFLERMPADMELRGASLGNLLLTELYFRFRRRLLPAVRFLANQLHVCGEVLPVTEEKAHLCAELRSGERVFGQHLLTGKSADPIRSPVKSFWLAKSLDCPYPSCVTASGELIDRILDAPLLVLPIGSFFSSVLCNLLPEGIGKAVGASEAPLVYMPNPGGDPELLGLTLQDQIDCIFRLAGRMPDYLILDETTCYPGALSDADLAAEGLGVIRVPIFAASRLMPEAAAEVLFSLPNGRYYASERGRISGRSRQETRMSRPPRP